MSSPSVPTPTEQTDLSLLHVQAELTRMDVLIHYEVRRWQVAGQDPADAFRGLHIADGEAETLVQWPLGASWGHLVALEQKEEEAFATAYAQASELVALVAETVHGEDQTPRLEHLSTTFALDSFDMDTFLICLAPSLDLRYERLYGFLQDDVTRKRPTANLVLNLLTHAGPPDRLPLLLRFSEEAPLFKYHLLERELDAASGRVPLLSQALSVDPAVVAWLLGDYHPHVDLGAHASLSWPEESEPDVLLAGPGRWDEIKMCMTRVGTSLPPVVVFTGPDTVGQDAAARLWAARSGQPLLTVDMAAAITAGTSASRVLRLAVRDARLTDALPYLSGWDACLSNHAGPAANGDRGDSMVGPPPADLLSELFKYPGMVLVAGQASWQAEGVDRERPLLRIPFPVPPYAQREAVWEHYLGTKTPQASGALDLSALAGQFALSSGQIRDAVSTVRDQSVREGRPPERRDLYAAARAHSSPNLGSLARKIEPRYSWEDIVLPEDQLSMLRELVATVRGRPLVLQEWGVGSKLASSSGVSVLFSGEPGTGKTMGAEIIAQELGLDLYKIDLSTVVSKYIGETEKNLEKIFREAQSSNAILFFDEADAIFGKRSEVKDAHDRYANIEVSYLLQRMEMYDGVTILATNLRANLDEAFTRRLQFAVDFPFPDEADRLRIWETLFPADVPREPDLDFEMLSQRFKLAGGSIRNILVGAAYLAAADGRRVSMAHLLHSTRRELQKMGRLVNEQDMRL